MKGVDLITFKSRMNVRKPNQFVCQSSLHYVFYIAKYAENEMSKSLILNKIKKKKTEAYSHKNYKWINKKIKYINIIANFYLHAERR